MPRRTAAPLLAVPALAVAGALVYLAAVETRTGARLDAELLERAAAERTPRASEVAHRLISFIDPVPWSVAAAILVVLGLWLHGLRRALMVGAAMLAAAATTQLLKPLLAASRPFETEADGRIAEASWPSGHTTGVAVLALALVLVAPARLRAAAAVFGAASVLAVSGSLVLEGTHFPSDVLGAWCVAGAWFAVAAWLLPRSRAQR